MKKSQETRKKNPKKTLQVGFSCLHFWVGFFWCQPWAGRIQFFIFLRVGFGYAFILLLMYYMYNYKPDDTLYLLISRSRIYYIGFYFCVAIAIIRRWLRRSKFCVLQPLNFGWIIPVFITMVIIFDGKTEHVA